MRVEVEVEVGAGAVAGFVQSRNVKKAAAATLCPCHCSRSNEARIRILNLLWSISLDGLHLALLSKLMTNTGRQLLLVASSVLNHVHK